MCILVGCKPGTIPTREELVLGSESNPHGFGYAIVIDGKMVVNKSMKPDALIDEFLELRRANMNSCAIFHARYASHGSIDIDNCHPFYLGEDKQSVLAHNGNFPNDNQPKDSSCSDTRWFAETVMPSLGGIQSLDNPVFCEMLINWSGSNRVIFLTANAEMESQMYTIGYEHGSVDDDGVWWSNDFHKWFAPMGASSKFGSSLPS